MGIKEGKKKKNSLVYLKRLFHPSTKNVIVVKKLDLRCLAKSKSLGYPAEKYACLGTSIR